MNQKQLQATVIITASLFVLPFHGIALKDYGVQGHTFSIQEKSLLAVIKEKLHKAEKSGKMKQLQECFKEKVKAKVLSPVAVEGLMKATQNRTFFYDPSYTQKEAIKDHEGRVVIPAGTTVNPLDHIEWGEHLLLIDGDDEMQMNWALKQGGKIILVKGKPLDLQKQHERWFYFDQGGIISRKFGITQVPALISQVDKKLKVEEIVV